MMAQLPSSERLEAVSSENAGGPTGDNLSRLRADALSKAYLHPEMTIVEISTRTEPFLADLAPAVKKVYWFSPSSALLQAVRRQFQDVNNVDFQLVDGPVLPLLNRSVDGIFADLDLSSVSAPFAGLHEYLRVVRPGGRLVLSIAGAGFEQKATGSGIKPDRIKAWLQTAGLVNVIVADDYPDRLPQSEEPEDEPGTGRWLIAVGTRRVTARQVVQDSYGARAQENEACCGDNCCSPVVVTLDDLGGVDWNAGYAAAELSEIPVEAAEFSLGCGNPVAMASLQPGETVLDIGSGGGIDVFLAARQVGEKGFVIGVDMTEAMLARARRTAQQNGITNVEFRAGYAEALPLEDDLVDVVISNCVINLSEDKGQVFSEAYRVIKPGGRLEVNDTVFESGVLPAVRTSNTGWAECISGALPEGEYLDLVRQAGFRELSVRRSTSSGTSAGVPIYSIQVSARK
ncbi:MAG: arsenite methyltransferase [Anaerolineales bacterium]|nr:arsenite methyltransferase [Anaerolineales bacterium]